MHSRIFTILFTEEDLNGKMISLPTDDDLADELESQGFSFFDYIKDSRDFDYDIDWLQKCYPTAFKFTDQTNGILNVPDLNPQLKKVVITKDSLKSHYYEKADAIKEYMDEKGIHPEDDLWVYHMKNLIEETNSGFFFYTLADSHKLFYSCASLDSFLLQVQSLMDCKKLNEVVFYIVGTYDYHN